MLPVASLPEDTQRELNTLTSINPRDLNEDQKAFLRARKSYLRPEQVKIFEEVLGIKKKIEEVK
jgi:hypothetical protein